MNGLRSKLVLPLIALLASATLAQAAETQNSLGLSSGLNLLVFKDLSATSSDVQGRVAVGGDMSVSGYSINTTGNQQALYGGNGLTVGGDLKIGGGSYWGNTVVGGNLTSTGGASFPGGSVQVGGDVNANGQWLSSSNLSYGGTATNLAGYQSGVHKADAGTSFSLGLDFAAEQTRLTSLSAQLDGLANTGSAGLQWSTFNLDAQGANLAVFDVSAADVNNNLALLNLGSDATVIINVHGSSVSFGGHGITNFSGGRVLFNLVDATSVSFSGGMVASFLAPLANFSTTWGHIDGQVIANSWSGSVQVNDAAFTGTLPTIAAVPEPETYALLLAGLAVVIFLALRRGNKP
jgi:choice-of-anchor A domain-containing protein